MDWRKHGRRQHRALGQRHAQTLRGALGETKPRAMMPAAPPVVAIALSIVTLYMSTGASSFFASSARGGGGGGAGSGGGGHLSSPPSSTSDWRTASSLLSM